MNLEGQSIQEECDRLGLGQAHDGVHILSRNDETHRTGADRRQRLTESASFTVVPAMSNTTRSIFMRPLRQEKLGSIASFAQLSTDDSFSEAEGQSHAGAT